MQDDCENATVSLGERTRSLVAASRRALRARRDLVRRVEALEQSGTPRRVFAVDCGALGLGTLVDLLAAIAQPFRRAQQRVF